MKIRQNVQPPKINITNKLSAVSTVSKTNEELFNIVDRDAVKILKSPKLDICRHKHIFVITSAMANQQLRFNGKLKSRK